MVGNCTENWSADDTLRVLIASDIHLGHLEEDPVRGEDSFIAFEEVLSLAVKYDVDFILLGGDLFDHAKPSPNCMFKCTQIIRKYCLGDKPVSVEVLSDQLENFARRINYEDPNLNVSYPILSIHGNHDDPVGQGNISSLDILSITGLVNYFGRCNDYTQVSISPVLMQKGVTKLALYGLSHMKDQRLARLFHEKKVEMEILPDNKDWLNLLVLHQNRADRGPNNYIREDVLPDFLDLVIWGHEHDSLVYPIKGRKAENDGFSVIQPGSTVITSLAAGEALPKHCVLLQAHNSEYTITPLPLKTVRPFVFKTIVLSEENFEQENVKENEKVQAFLKVKVNEAIEEAKNRRSDDPKQPALPLIRISVFYEREGQDFNRVRFGQEFSGLVANPNDVLIMKREKKIREKKEKSENEDVEMATAAADATDIESLIRAYYEALPPERRLTVLSVRSMTEAVRDFTLKHDDAIFKQIFDAHRRRCVDFLMESTAETEEDIKEKMQECKSALDSADAEQLKCLIAAAAALAKQTNSTKINLNSKQKGIVEILSSDDEADQPAITPSTRSRGRGSRGSRARSGPRSRGRGRAASPESSPTVPERRTPRRTAAQKSNSLIQSLITKSISKGRVGVSSEDSD